MSGMKVLVTGSTGFLGGYVLEELVENGYEVRATDLPKSDFSIAEKLGVEITYSDLLDYDSVRKVMKGMDAVIHLGGIFRIGGERRLLFDVNVRGTENACRAACAEGISRFVHFSTVAIYARPERIPIDEEGKVGPHDTYGMTKWWGERVALRYNRDEGLPVVRIRPTVVYGPRGKYVASLIFAGGMIPRYHGLKRFRLFSGGLHCSWVHASDVAGAAVYLLGKEDAVGKAFNIADDTPVQASEMLRMMLEMYGIEVEERIKYYDQIADPLIKLLSRVPEFVDNLVNRRLQRFWDRVVIEYGLEPTLEPTFSKHFMLFFAKDMAISNARLKEAGYKVKHPDFRKGFWETVAWYREKNWIPDISSVA